MLHSPGGAGALRRLALLAVALLLALLCMLLSPSSAAGTPANLAPAGCGDGPPRSGQVYLGAWIPAAYDDPRTPRAADPAGQFDTRAGKGVSILQRWEHWGLGPGGRIDIKWLRRVAEAGAYPMITWVPWDPTVPSPGDHGGFLLRDIANGAHEIGRAHV